MTTITIKELHARTGEWVRKAADFDEITVTDRGTPVAKLTPLTKTNQVRPKINPFLNRRLVPGYAEFMNAPFAGTDVTTIISEDRDRP